MQESKHNQGLMDKERAALRCLAAAEDLAEKKARIFSRLLIDVGLAQEMEALATRHQQRKTALLALCGQKADEEEEE